MGCLVFGGGHVAEATVQSLVVVPLDPAAGGCFDWAARDFPDSVIGLFQAAVGDSR